MTEAQLSLPPPRRIAEVPVEVNRDGVLHRAGCERVAQPVRTHLEVGEFVETLWAPTLCPRCKPAMRIGLGG